MGYRGIITTITTITRARKHMPRSYTDGVGRDYPKAGTTAELNNIFRLVDAFHERLDDN